MRTTLLPLLLLIAPALHAQLTAGEVPPGSITYSPGIELSLFTQFTEDSADIELDCDDFADLRVWLHRGAPELDAPNIAELHFLDTDIEVCMDSETSFAQRPKYHAFGESLNCTGDYSWQAVDPITLGNFGGFLGMGPWSIDSMYIALRRMDEIGWMLLSFDVNGNPDVDLQVHELLPLCQIPTSVDEHGLAIGPVLFPNPSSGAPIEVRSADALRSIEVLDPSGRMVAQYGGNVRSMAAPEVAGVYSVRILNVDGRWSVMRLVRY